jgi:heme-degrading monooxygenase HmoA
VNDAPVGDAPVGDARVVDAAVVDAAVLEVVVLPVRAGTEAEFEEAFDRAEPLIARAHGYRGHSLRRGIDRPSTYLLTVGWDSVEDHEVGFRESDDYVEWAALLHRFYDPFPIVLHYGEDLTTHFHP